MEEREEEMKKEGGGQGRGKEGLEMMSLMVKIVGTKEEEGPTMAESS